MRNLWQLFGGRSGQRPQPICKPPFPALIRDEFGDGKPKCFFWEGRVKSESWCGFASEAELKASFGSAEIPTEGDLVVSVSPVNLSSPEPTEAQCRAFQHLLDNEKAIRDAVLQGIFEAYPEWRRSYFGPISMDGGKSSRPIAEFPDLYHPEMMPEVCGPEELMRLIRPHTIHVLAEPFDGYTRIGFGFDCKWDEEHGLGVLTHQGKVVSVGDGTEAFDPR